MQSGQTGRSSFIIDNNWKYKLLYTKHIETDERNPRTLETKFANTDYREERSFSTKKYKGSENEKGL